MTLSKDVVVFYLRRHLRDLEDRVSPVDLKKMAEQGKSYGKRKDAVTAAEKAQEQLATEIRAYEEAIRIVMASASSKT